MKKLFIFDVDDVIYELKHIIRDALTDATGKDIHPDNWFSFNLNEVYDVNMETIFNAFHKFYILRNGSVNLEIYPVLEYLKKNNIETMAVTARGWHSEGNEITRRLFADNDIGINSIHVVQHHEKKSEVISKIEGFEIVGYIDDNARHIQETKNACGSNIHNYFLKDQPWNQHYSVENEIGVHRIDKLASVPEKLDIILGQESKVQKKRNFKI